MINTEIKLATSLSVLDCDSRKPGGPGTGCIFPFIDLLLVIHSLSITVPCSPYYYIR